MVERKGVDITVRALADVPGAELIVAGGGDPATDPEVARLSAVAEDCGVRDRVHFLGRIARAEVAGLIRSADLVVSVPWYEPFGMVPLEAMACGVPVIASAVGGHLDTVVDGRTGALVPPRDAAALAGRLRDLLTDDATRAAMGAAGAVRARSRYAWGRIAAETERLYRQALRSAGDRSTAATGG